MRLKTLLIAGAAAGVLALSVGIVEILSPAGSASATSSQTSGADAAGLLNDMAPGATVTEQADGSVSVAGQLSDAARADLATARRLAASGPTVIRCSAASDTTVNCSPVPDGAVATAIDGGEPGLYSQRIYRGITGDVTDKAAPFFEASELVCSHLTGPTIECSRVDRVQPTIAKNDTVFMTYAPLDATMSGDTMTIRLLGTPTVKLVRGS